VNRNVVIVGGGLSGLAASIVLARGGRTVTLFEKRQHLGGRAISNLRQGFRFNLGAHALYRNGAASRVYRELGIPADGGIAKPRGVALHGEDEHKFPGSLWSILTTSLLSPAARLQMIGLWIRLWRIDPSRYESVTLRQWLDEHVRDPRLREVAEAFFRLFTYADHADTERASLALAQAKIAVRGVKYLHEGWQKLVDSLHNAAVAAGVNFVSSSRIVGVHHRDGAVQSVELGGLEFDADRMDTQAIAYPEVKPEDVEGARIPASTVILAVDPMTAADLVDDASITSSWTALRPVTAACLDVALKRLPDPKNVFALGIDRPLYLSVHSAFSQVAPKGGALIHTAKYLKEQRASGDDYDNSVRRRGGTSADEAELEELLDRVQPGWREVLVHRRFLPAMTVANALVTPDAPRPSHVTPIRGLYIAGDWVGSEGLLSDAALASAHAAAKAVLSDVSS
jgi:phytoene dehydrogenase-like protein